MSPPCGRPPRGVVVFVVVALGYAAGSQAAFSWFGALGLGGTFFPPAGLTLAAFVVVGRRHWPAVAAAVLVAEVALDTVNGLGPAAGVGFALANIAEPLAGALLLGAHRGRRVDLERREDLFRFVAGPVLVAPLLGAVLAATTDALFVAPDRFLDVAVRIWLGDGLGVLVVGGALLATRSPDSVWRVPHRRPEAVALVLLATAGSAAVVSRHALPLAYLVAVLLVWIAFRLGVAGVTSAGLGVAFAASASVAGERGIAADLGVSPGLALSYVQALVAVVLVTTAALAAEIRERERTVLRAATADSHRLAAETAYDVERRALRRAELLHAVTAALGTASTLDEVARAVHGAGLVPLDAGATSVGVLGPDGAFRVATLGFPDAVALRNAALPADADLPGPAAVRDGRARWFGDRAGTVAEFPAVAELLDGTAYAAAAVLPLHRAGEPVGYIAAHFVGEREFPPDERTLLEAVALQVENSLERVRLYELSVGLREVAERRAARQRVRIDVLERLNAAGGAALRRRLLVEALVPEIADLAVLVVPGRGGRPQQVAAAPAWAPGHGAVVPDVADVLATGRAVLSEHLVPHPHVPPALAPVSSITVPLRAGDAVVGALRVCFTDSGRRHRPEDVGFVRDLATGAALAIENARLYEAEHRIAEVLQTSLLPQELPRLPGLTLGSRYLAGAAGTQAGGDWYDVLALDEHRAAVVVGDVVGNGPGAAAVMGQLRSAVACALLDGHGPARVLEQLDRFAARVPGARGSTAACVVVDRARGELCWARAGHPPPLLLDDGRVRLLEGPTGTVLGVPGRPPYRENRVAAGPGATVLLYTDGLVERRGEVIDDGVARLADHAAALAHRDPDALLGDLLDRLVPAGRPSDDVAVVAARILPPALHLRVPAVPGQLRPVRGAVRGWAAGHALPADVTDDLLLALGESVANAVEHAYPAGRPGEVECALERAADGTVAVTVRDSGTWRPVPSDNGHRGHGLTMIRAVTDAVEVERLPTGTTVRFRLGAG
ncbi:SpoIIE family protein phosphatase [Pseudonocardia hydrocarbonoxydans]|uniref:SpoIIE family protein phosphatase n=1 Tax=Pseudonocardia hydrocarbonoxydans TaxID=76726 RepID=UPI001141A599|nr:SpoIIE family protein phosphatase [Pseudonocardia hydrocarbonoxydans]